MSKRKYFSEEELADAKKAWSKKYYEANREKCNAYGRERRIVLGKDVACKRSALWRAKNRDKANAIARASYWRNHDKRIAGMVRWRSKNNHIVNANTAKRRAKTEVHPFASQVAISDLYMKARESSMLGIGRYVVDHIIPISSGGFHHELNMQVIGAILNNQKSDNAFWIKPSPEYKDWRDVPEFLWPESLKSQYIILKEKSHAPMRSLCQTRAGHEPVGRQYASMGNKDVD